MRSEAENQYQGKFLVRIRKDGTIKLPKELEWNPGTLLSLEGYGFEGSYFLVHLRNSQTRNRRLAEIEGIPINTPEGKSKPDGSGG